MVISCTAIAGGMNIHLLSGTLDDIALFQALMPHLAWPLMLILAIYLYVAIMPRFTPKSYPATHRASDSKCQSPASSV
jgi:hypothetical protein